MAIASLTAAALRPGGLDLTSSDRDFIDRRIFRNGPDEHTRALRDIQPSSGESSLGFKPVYRPDYTEGDFWKSLFRVPKSSSFNNEFANTSYPSGIDYHMRATYDPDGVHVDRTAYDQYHGPGRSGVLPYRVVPRQTDNTIAGNIEQYNERSSRDDAVRPNVQTTPKAIAASQSESPARRSSDNDDQISLHDETPAPVFRAAVRSRTAPNITANGASNTKGTLKTLATGVGVGAVAHAIGSTISSGGGIIQQKMKGDQQLALQKNAQEYQTQNINRATDYLKAHNIPWLPGNSNVHLPSTNQHVQGHNYIQGPTNGANPYSFTNNAVYGVGEF